MKNILTILFFFLSFIAFPQDSWVNVVVQTDQYGGETTWEIYQDSQIVATSLPYQGNYYYETLVMLPPGGYNFVIYDSFGDGICCDFGEGYFGLSNICGLNTFVYDFNGPTATVYFDLLACPPPVLGCMDVEALNFNPWANIPGPCTFPPAACDSGQTNIITLITPDSYPNETSWQLTVNGDTIASGGNEGNTGVTIPTYACVNVGDTLVASIYDTYGDGLCGSCWGGVDGYFNVTTLCGDSIFFIGGVQQFDTASSGPYVVPACVPVVIEGCTDPGYVEYNVNAVLDNNTCLTEVVLGCVDESALNYNALANTMEVESSCNYTLVITDGGADGWFGSWLGVTQGDSIYGPYQMGPNDGYEENFNLSLNSNEEVSIYFFTSGNAETTAAQCGFRLEGPNSIVLQSGTNPWTDPLKKFPYVYKGMPVCSNYCVVPVLGCTDELACNYNLSANVDEGCLYSIEYYDCSNACNNDADGDNVCDELEVVGCIDPTAFNYNNLATDADDCEPFIFGCTDPTQYNYDTEANTENGGCVPYINGCTDSLAFNYDSLANTDNGSCIESLEGCADLQAYNYEALVNIPNSESCLYEAVGCVTGLGEPYGDGYWLNDMCFAWVIEVDPYCCNVSWDGTCIELYNYCEADPTGVSTIELSALRVYPNPTNNIINIVSPFEVVTTVYDVAGRIVVNPTVNTKIELSSLPDGIYEVRVKYKERIESTKIIKQ